ncbi:SDR family NAD(P)-dependent oxidoreductase [Streptomyces sp. NPDC059605]|uniref:SDR family NAD(P)-dependent oxidoreductase n=1 Tax=Streptomyces sp. NPDC059605 TaxID=3346882 RepID=UPI00369C5767
MADNVEPIAVIGMACRLPGAPDLDAFWQNLADGRESIASFGPEELAAAGVPAAEAADPDYVPAAPMMPEVDRFDAELFGMTAAEARLCDPQIRTFLELCHAAVEHAGHDPFALPDSVGVFGTTGPNTYLRHILTTRPDLVEGSPGMTLFTLNNADYLATLVSYKLDLRGPSMTVLTACSSSLVTVHMAAQALRAGECDAALAGGATVELPLGHGHLWTPGGVLTRDGHCRPFDASASGTVFGSGAGVVLLKRLDDALTDGDRVLAVIRGSAVNNDGSDKVSFSAPSVGGQSAAVAEAMLIAGVSPGEVDYVEAHATGTALGDPIEVAALTEAYEALSDGPVTRGRTAIGSVKSNIGHMNSVAGVAGLIKTVLMLEHETIAAGINITEPNPRLELDRTPFDLVTRPRSWPRREGRRRIAAVSSLGIGGTNAHLVLEEGPVAPLLPPREQPRLVVWSARDEEGIDRLRGRLADRFAAAGETDFGDAVGTLQRGRTAHRVRAALVASSAADAAAGLAGGGPGVAHGRIRPGARRAFLFPGQGAHRARMAAGLYGTVRSFSVAMDECLELFEQSGVRLDEAWLGEERPEATETVQPLLFAVEYALAEMWRAWGVVPEAVIGHSLGELAAAAVAGIFDLPDAVRLVVARAAAMADHPCPGGMLAVAADSEAIGDLLTPPLAVAAVNGPAQTVVSGPHEALAELSEQLGDRRIANRPLPVAQAFHHPGWAAAAERFTEAFATVAVRAPVVPLHSVRTGRPVTVDEAKDPAFWAGQLTGPVLFGPALETLTAEGEWTLLETGPGRTLTTLARRSPAAREGRVHAVAALGTGDDEAAALTAAGLLWLDGAALDWEALGQPRALSRRPVPGYPYRRDRHWIDPLEPTPGPTATADRISAAPEVASPDAPAADPRPIGAEGSGDAPSPLSVVDWLPAPVPPPAPVAGGTALVLLPAAPESALTVVLAAERAGWRTVRLRPADTPGEADGEFRIRLGEPADLAEAAATLAERGVHADLVLHAAGFDSSARPGEEPLAGQLDAALHSLAALARAAMTRPPGRPAPRFLVLTSEAVDVSGGEQLAPARATAVAFARTLAAEEPGMRVGVVDVARRTGIAELAAELARPTQEPVVALRGSRRWVPVEQPLPLPAPVREPLRERGVYLITGGFGGLGLALARRLAGSGLRPRLVLLGRRDPTAPGADPDDPFVRRARAALTEIAALGAEALAVGGDVAEPGVVSAALDAARDRFGAVNGVFHLAGVGDGRMVAFRERAHAEAVLAPKTAGAVLLAEALADRPLLDFVVLFGSRAAAEGLVGSGDYAAANAFLDAAAQALPFHAARVLDVGWPVWLGEGMVDPDGPDLGGLAELVARLADGRPAEDPEPAFSWEKDFGAATHWILDEHRVGRVPLLPGSGYVDLVVNLFTEHLATPGGAVELRDVVFRAPFSDERVRRLRVVFTGAADGTGYDFTVASRPADRPDEAWTEHVTGRAATVDAAPRRVDIEGLRAGLEATGTRPVDKVPTDLAFTMGPRWRNIEDVQQRDEERLLRLALLPALVDDLREHRLHPALLDTATAGVRSSGEGAFVPFLYRRLIVHADLPAQLYSHVRRAPSDPDTAVGDIDLIAPDGAVLAQVEGFTMRRVEFEPGWDRPQSARPSARGSGAAPAEPSGTEGLAPEAGLRLLLRLLAGDSPRSVLVRPHLDGVPVPIAGAVSRPESIPVPSDPSGAAADGHREPPVTAAAVTVAPAPAPAAVPDGQPAASGLAALWHHAIGAPPADEDEDFFEAGGNSLSAVELIGRIRAAYGLELSIGLLLDVRTYGGLREIVEAGGDR